MKISIITATFNSVSTLESTIKSVLSQTYSNFEHIIIDGGSTDGTLLLLENYQKQYKGRLRWISEKDKGIYDAMNKGIQLATGDIIGMLNSDDFYTSPNVLQTIANSMSDKKIDGIYADLHFVKPQQLQHCVRYYSSASFTPKLLRIGFAPPHPTLYLRKTIYHNIGLYKTDFSISGDFELMLRLFVHHKYNIQYIAEDFVTMRLGGVSTKGWNSIIKGLKYSLKACKENGLYSNYFLISLKFGIKVLQFFKPFSCSKRV